MVHFVKDTLAIFAAFYVKHIICQGNVFFLFIVYRFGGMDGEDNKGRVMYNMSCFNYDCKNNWGYDFAR